MSNCFLVSDNGITESTTENPHNVREDFKQFVKDYIKEKDIKDTIITQMTDILVRELGSIIGFIRTTLLLLNIIIICRESWGVYEQEQ